MKICSVQFENLNSLTGRWEVDFTTPEYESAGIFAITGPTGAGKTTLLDAICLALYAETPRLGRISQSSNDILSRHQGTCEAHVTFQCAQGTYVGIFEQHRARKKSSGNLVAPNHHLIEAESGKIVEDKLSRTAQKVAALTGLNFTQFCRSAMLAQGDFAAFLNADEGERSAILEQITGTKIYSDISKAVHEHKRREDDALRELQLGKSAVFVLSNEEQTHLQKERCQHESHVASLENVQQELQAQLSWRKEVQKTENALQTLTAQKQTLDEQNKTLAPKRTKLDAAKRAQTLSVVYASLSEKQLREQQNRGALRQAESELPQKQQLLIERQAEHQTAQAQLDECLKENDEEMVLQKKVHLLDGEIHAKRLQYKEARGTVHQLESQCDEARNRLVVLETKRFELESTRALCASLLKDEPIAEASATSASKQLQQTRRILQTRLTHLREKQTLTLKIISLEKERAHLTEGTPCPLCGSLKHPFAHNTPPELTAVENEINTAEQQLQQVLHALEMEASIATDIAVVTQIIAERTTQLEEARQQMSVHQTSGVTLAEKRQALYGDKDPDDQARRWKEKVASARKKEADGASALRDFTAQTAALERTVHTLQTDATTLQQQKDDAQIVFEKACLERGFSTEKTFLAARLPEAELEALHQQINVVDERLTRIAAQIEERRVQLDDLLNEAKTNDLEEALSQSLAKIEQEIGTRREKLGALKERLAESQKGKDALNQLQTKIDAQQKNCLAAADLHALIGSSDGKKYRNIAQGLTFERLLSHANVQLAKMTDRYLLLPDGATPLTLNVLDNFQAGEIRTTKNLSGGESFVVSLALALGLSQMAGQKVRIDSLFLDEGFGSLDDDALETALETLGSLHKQGKLIGIISHVAALKERLAVQITVTKQSGGTSILTGPGCRRLTD